DSLFGVRTDRIPREVHASPRIGFTWTFAAASGGREGARQGLPQGILRGGVGDFRSLPPTALYSAALGAPGLATAETQLECIGSAVPTPNWAQYAQDPATIPSQCVDTASAVTISPRPNATVFDPGYAAPRAWRASLGLQQQLPGSYTFTRARDQSSFSCCAASQGFAAPTTAGDPNAREWATSALERRHSLLATVTYPVSGALEVTALGRLTSGVPFTPLVGSDINGDGARNDRAFVFDPATASDSSVATGMRA